MVFLKRISSDVNKTEWISINVFSEGYVGVGFFFILSGFILAYNYKDTFSINISGSKTNFWLKRFARVYPVHLLTLLLSVPLVYIQWRHNLKGFGFPFALNFFLLQSYILPLKNWFWYCNTVSWSVSVEMFFYFLFPFLAYILNRKKTFFILFVVLTALTIPILMSVNFMSEMRIERFYIQPYFRIADFLIGVLLHEIYLKLKNSIYIKLSTHIELFSIFLFLLFFTFHSFVPPVYRFSCYYWLPICLIILIFSFQKGAISHLFSNKYFVYLGEISYSFYMFHSLVIQYFKKLNYQYSIFQNDFLFVCFLLYFSLLISAICYKYFKKPLNGYIIKKLCK